MRKLFTSQCTFWCLVLSDRMAQNGCKANGCLNAPSGAWCFPTSSDFFLGCCCPVSQCTFWCLVLSDQTRKSLTLSRGKVSMHLLVLGAFRLHPQKTAPQRRLPKRNRRRPRKHRIRPAHTAPIKPHNRRKPPQTTPAPPTLPTHQYTTGFQQTQAKKPPPQGYLSETILTIFFNE